ncbi:SPOR domain-containing protein [Candidatus Pelagibacter sp.]|nr:SPOR domain-containing protein [Candidatus Pelagibacter sp.]
MNFKKLILIIFIFFLSACNQFDQKNKNLVYITDQKYSNTGFTLIYDDELKKEKKISKKIDNRSLLIFHNKIIKNSFVKITNPVNDKSIIAEVISNNVKFSPFYNSVITKRIAEELSLDPKEPYINLLLISKNSTFIAKKAKTFDEEKKVAEKAPVDGITIDNLGKEKEKEVKIKKQKFLYSIKIADFYYKDSAESMVNRIKDETNIKKSVIKKLSKTKYRVLLGPFNDIKKLEKSFNEIKVLNFENIEILKDV